MRLLLDTHVMYWWLRDSPRLGPRAKAFIAAPQAELLVSFASFWELSVKARLGKLPECGSVLLREAAAGNLLLLGLKPGHLEVLEGIEMRPDHKDPFDRLILAQAVSEGATLVTRDVKLLAYDVPGYRVR
jgi:PIN domain nuclease of toxin-antitoxin system